MPIYEYPYRDSNENKCVVDIDSNHDICMISAFTSVEGLWVAIWNSKQLNPSHTETHF